MSETLTEVILRRVKPGTIIYTDCWKGYVTERLNKAGMKHKTVNHSKYYVDPVTGVHTNTIEGTWGAIKWNYVPVRQRDMKFVNGDLLTFIWKRKHANNLWERLLYAISLTKYNNIYINDEDDVEVTEDDWLVMLTAGMDTSE